MKGFVSSYSNVKTDLENVQKTIRNKCDEIVENLQTLFDNITSDIVSPEKLIQGTNKVLHELETTLRECAQKMEKTCVDEAKGMFKEENELKLSLQKIQKTFNKVIEKHKLNEKKFDVNNIQMLSESEIEEKVSSCVEELTTKLQEKEQFPLTTKAVEGRVLSILSKSEIEETVKKVLSESGTGTSGVSPASTSFNIENLSDKEIGVLIRKMKAFNEEEKDNSDSEGEYEDYVESNDTEKELKERKKKIRALKKSVEDLLPHAALKTRRPYHAGDFAPDQSTRRNCSRKKISPKLFENIETRYTQKFGEGAESQMHDEKKRSHVAAVFREGVKSPKDLTPILDQIPTKFRCVYEDCGKAFPDLTRVSQHYIQKHSEHVPARKKRIYACHHCAKLFVTSKQAKACAQSHFPYETGKSYFCMLCLYENHEAAIKTSEGHLLDHLMAKHRKSVKRPFHACAVCDTSQNSTMKRGVCQNFCLKKSKKPVWSCKTCEKDFASYREKVEHFLKDDKDGQDHDLFRLYLVEPGNTKKIEKNDDSDSVVSVRKGKHKLSIKTVDKENPLKKKVSCPKCPGPVADRPGWTYEREDEMLTKLKQHFISVHKERDIQAYLNETQQRLFDILEVEQPEEEEEEPDKDTLSEASVED